MKPLSEVDHLLQVVDSAKEKKSELSGRMKETSKHITKTFDVHNIKETKGLIAKLEKERDSKKDQLDTLLQEITKTVVEEQSL